ncbi:MAG: glycogen debranching enzyme N-terminal domain-containing protein, partial [Planctomycetes bacterium]|nr:glycogen debranching enzyme N-terminal domain-containing protein [Planctomycetota bacterium]
MHEVGNLPEAIVIDCAAAPLADLLSKEWLVTNKLGSYASSTVIGANTRRYHGLLVAATLPPVGRQVLLSNLLEEVIAGDRTLQLSTFQFAGATSPSGYAYLWRFINDVAPTWIFKFANITVTRQLILAERSNTLAVRYKVDSPAPVQLRLWPFATLRDFHALRRFNQPQQITFVSEDDGIRIEDRQFKAQSLWVGCDDAQFVERSQWWYRFQYAVDIRRGQEGFEDLYTPGYFQTPVQPGQWIQFTAAVQRSRPINFDATMAGRRRRLSQLASAVGDDADDTTRRLAIACDDFLVTRNVATGPSATIVAGYHWFGDWGRDSFIALEGLALLTGQYDLARQVLDTFAHAISEGMVPNRFDDYGGPPHYNSIDASLWFVLAVDRYIRTTGDEDSWAHEFAGPVQAILKAYHDGTRFQIHADADGLITGGSSDEQLTWMDVKFNNQAITPRQGKPVEVNALWLESLFIMAERCRGFDDQAADYFAAEAQRVAASFVRAFWHEEGGYLYDCVSPTESDRSLRPNQVIAVAMPHCPLGRDQQLSVLQVVVENLLTPCGLRTLAPSDPRYRGQYGGSWESRDHAYHQGTVWAWLMGPMVQAYLKVHDFSEDARRQAAAWLEPFDRHLYEAGMGKISEIFDGNHPHAPRGCIAQAWSV